MTKTKKEKKPCFFTILHYVLGYTFDLTSGRPLFCLFGFIYILLYLLYLHHSLLDMMTFSYDLYYMTLALLKLMVYSITPEHFTQPFTISWALLARLLRDRPYSIRNKNSWVFTNYSRIFITARTLFSLNTSNIPPLVRILVTPSVDLL